MLPGWLCIAVAVACASADRAIVSEVYYDAIGDDTGHEYVELFNPTSRVVPLQGVRLEAGDGAGANRWTLRWTGGPADSMGPGERCVVGGSLVAPVPRHVVTLDLQNGPDAVRLVWPDGVVEVVGYGALAYPEYFCGAPAPDVASGLALARIPDAAATGSNASDFRAAVPSPGRPNQARRNLAVPAGSLALDRERPEPGVPFRFSGRITNRGADTLAVADLSIGVEVEPLDDGFAVPRLRPDSAFPGVPRAAPVTSSPPVLGPQVLAPGDTLGLERGLDPLAAGRYRLWLTASVAGDEAPEDDRDSLRFRVGEGALAVTEIQFHPADGEGEWVEVRNRSARPVDPAAITLSDRGTTRGVPREGMGPLAPESLAVLAQDRAALLAAFPTIAADRVWQVSPWAALNNGDDSSGVADHVVIRGGDGLVETRVAYRAAGVPAGVPLELRDGAWLPALDPRGTPLTPPRAPPPAARRFDVRPARASAEGGVVRLEWALPWPRARLRADLYDLDGRRIATLLPDTGAPARGERTLNLHGLAPGLFWVVLEARSEPGGARLTEARPLRLVGRR